MKKVYAYTKGATVANISKIFDDMERSNNGSFLFYFNKNLVLYLPNDIIFYIENIDKDK